MESIYKYRYYGLSFNTWQLFCPEHLECFGRRVKNIQPIFSADPKFTRWAGNDCSDHPAAKRPVYHWTGNISFNKGIGRKKLLQSTAPPVRFPGNAVVVAINMKIVFIHFLLLVCVCKEGLCPV